MRSLLITAAVATAALALEGCQNKRRPEPVPPPQSARLHAAASLPAAHKGAPQHYSAGEIAWFQGTLDEAFSEKTCSRQRPPLSY